MKQTFLVHYILFLGTTLTLINGQTTGVGVNCNNPNKRPSLAAGATYTVNANCPNGGTYNTPASGSTSAKHCNCWSYCGYICNNVASPSPAPVTQAPAPAPTTTSSSSCANKRPPVPAGSKWVANIGCTRGTTYNIASPPQHCHCWGHCGYICDPTAAPSTTPAPANNCASKRPPVPSGSTWVANVQCTNGTTYNVASPPQHCHCWGRCGYICDPTTAKTTIAPTSTTTSSVTSTTGSSPTTPSSSSTTASSTTASSSSTTASTTTAAPTTASSATTSATTAATTIAAG